MDERATRDLIKERLAIGIFLTSVIWLALSLSDEFAGTRLLGATGLSFISGLPTSSAAFLTFYATTILALFIALFRPSVRSNTFEVPSLSAERLPKTFGLANQLRQMLPLSRIEWAAVFVVNAAILSVRFLLFPWPQGSDTPQYVEASNWILLGRQLDRLSPAGGLATGRSLAITLFTGLQTMIGLVTPAAEMVTPIVVPLLLGTLYSFAYASFIFLLTQNRRLAFWGAILAPASFMTIRLSYDLFAQFLGQAVMIIALGMFIRYLIVRHDDAAPAKTTGWVVSAVFIVGLFAHMWTWAILTIISIAIGLWILIANRSSWKQTLVRGLVALGPSLALMGVLAVAFPAILFSALYAFSVGDARPFGLDVGWYWMGGWDSAFVWLFSVLGLVSVLGNKSESTLRAPLLIWTFTISVLIFATGYNDAYRLIIVYPVPLQVLLGARKLRTWLTPGFGARIAAPEATGRLAALGLTILIVATVIPAAYVPVWRYWVGEAGYDQLQQIRAQYGFGNASIVILVDQSNFDNAFQWSAAITGAQVYPGCLVALLLGDPFKIDSHRWISPNLQNVSEVLLPDTLYNTDGFERGLLSPGKVPGVPAYETKRRYDPSAFLGDRSFPLAASFWQGWVLNISTMDYSFSTENSSLRWSFTGHSASNSTGTLSFDRPLPSTDSASLYLLASGNLGGGTGEIDLQYRDQNVTSYVLDKIQPSFLLIRLALENESTPDSLHVRFWTGPGHVTAAGWFEVGFMAMLPA